MATQTIFQVKEQWRDDGASTYRVEHDGGQHDIYVKHGDLDENSIGWGTMEDDASLVEAFKAAWKRYHAEKAKRSVVVSAATMRPMEGLALDAIKRDKIHVLLKVRNLTDSGYRLKVGVHGNGGWIIYSSESSTAWVNSVDGWWPLPDLTFMPAQFGGWEV